MAQIIESRFRVLDIFPEDIYLSDLETGPPVHVEKDYDTYSENLKNTVASLKRGNLVKAEIRSESIAQQDGLWYFLNLEIEETTRFHFIDGAETHPSVVDNLKDHLKTVSDNSARKFIRFNNSRIGYITVAGTQSDEFWTGLQAGTKSHEKDLELLSTFGDAPHEVIYTRSSDEEFLVFYHLVNKETDLAKKIISSNSKYNNKRLW